MTASMVHPLILIVNKGSNSKIHLFRTLIKTIHYPVGTVLYSAVILHRDASMNIRSIVCIYARSVLIIGATESWYDLCKCNHATKCTAQGAEVHNSSVITNNML